MLVNVRKSFTVKKFLGLALCAGLFPTHLQAANLLVNGGQLTGATGVLVGSLYYDVTFVDGTCSGLYSGCNDSSDFTFTTIASAILAGNALLSDVFVDGTAGLFDSSPQLTAGCGNFFQCTIVTPFAPPEFVTVPGIWATNRALVADPAVSYNTLVQSYDTALSDAYVYAVWSPSAVPLPAAAWLFGSAILGLVGVARRKQA